MQQEAVRTKRSRRGPDPFRRDPAALQSTSPCLPSAQASQARCDRTPFARLTRPTAAASLGPARTSGRREGLTKKEAGGKLRELVLADNGGERSRNRAAPTVKEMGDALIARMRRDDLKKSHIETVSGHLRKHINPLLGEMLVSEVVESDTERLVTRLTNAGLAPKTIHNYIGTFHSVMGLAVRGRHIERNPATMAELPKVRKSKTLRFLNHDELDRVVSTELPESDRELVAAFPPSRKKDRTSEFGGPQAVRGLVARSAHADPDGGDDRHASRRAEGAALV